MIEYKKRGELSFEGNNALAKFLGFKFDWYSKTWESEGIIDIPKPLNVIDGFAVIEVDNMQVFVVDFDNKFLAREHSFAWKPEAKRWEKPLSVQESFPTVSFSEIEYKAIPQSQITATGVKTTLYEFQRKAVAKLIEQKRCYNGSDMGNGKTLMSIAAYMLTKTPETKLLIVCPATLKYNWKAEFLKHTNVAEEQITIVSSKLKAVTPITIINYDILEKNLDALLLEGFDFVIADECHYIKNIKAKRTRAFLSIANAAERLHLLSGTPITKNAADFYTATKALNIAELSHHSYNSFCTHFCYAVQKNFGGWPVTQYFGIRNEEELRYNIKPNFFRFEAKEVDLPEQIHSTFNVELSASEKREVKRLIEESQLALVDNDFNFEDLLKNEHIARLKSFVALSKAKKSASLALEMLEENEEQKLVIYSEHRKSTDVIVEELKAKKVNVAKIDGSVSQVKRDELIKEFQSGSLQVIVGTSAISTGLTLTAADIMIINDASYNVATNVQLYKRIHRIGQINRCKYYHVTVKIKDVYDIDNAIRNIILQKQQTIKTALEDAKTEEEALVDDLLAIEPEKPLLKRQDRRREAYSYKRKTEPKKTKEELSEPISFSEFMEKISPKELAIHCQISRQNIRYFKKGGKPNAKTKQKLKNTYPNIIF